MTLELHTDAEVVIVLRSLALYQRSHHGMTCSCDAARIAARLRALVPDPPPLVAEGDPAELVEVIEPRIAGFVSNGTGA